MNVIEKHDFETVIKQYKVFLEQLHNKTLFVTGATGFIGSAFVKMLLYYNSLFDANIEIVALIRNEEKAKEMFSKFALNKLTFVIGTIEKLPIISQSIDYIVHGASITSSFDFVKRPVETITTTMIGTQNILELAQRNRVKSMLYLSSMEVYGITNTESSKVSERDYGYIDVLNVRNCYPVSKQMAESLCIAYCNQYSVHVSIARLAQTIGSGIDYNDTRVAAYFARSVIEKKDIILNTKGTTTRNIIYISDVLSAMLTLMVLGEKGNAYNVAQSNEILTIAETAEMIAHNIAHDQIKVVYDLKDMPEYAVNRNLYLNLDTSKLEKLGWNAMVGVEEAYLRMIKGIKR
jgi:dTDP-glucose 4,6-dehydratase